VPGPITFQCSRELYLGWPTLIELLGATIEERVPAPPDQSDAWFETNAERIVIRRGDEKMQFLTYIVTNSDHSNGDPCIEPDFPGSESSLGENVFRSFLASGVICQTAWYCRSLFRTGTTYLIGANPFDSLLRPILEPEGAVIQPGVPDCWSVSKGKASLSLYTGPAMDFSNSRPCSYWAIDYPRGMFWTNRNTKYLAQQVASRFEMAGATRLL
jgi:hypothetical protein